jgi:hypothetical protein
VSTFGPAEARSAMRALWADQDHYACLYPELQMRVWASPKGMQLAAVLWLPGPKFGRASKVLAQATWAPSEVTEARVVDWGRRALAAWLDEQLADVNEEARDL